MPVFHFLDKVVKFFLAVSVIGVFVLILLSVFLRNFFGISLPWLEEFNNLIFVWMIFLGAAWGQVFHQQIAVSFLRDKFPHIAWVGMLVNAVSVSAGLFLLIFGARYAIGQAQVSSLFLRIPYWFYILPVALLGLIVVMKDGSELVGAIRHVNEDE